VDRSEAEAIPSPVTKLKKGEPKFVDWSVVELVDADPLPGGITVGAGREEADVEIKGIPATLSSKASVLEGVSSRETGTGVGPGSDVIPNIELVTLVKVVILRESVSWTLVNVPRLGSNSGNKSVALF
jgi:hypothetical protein